MAEATATFHLGAETVTSVLDVDLGPVETILTGDIDAVVPAGTTARLTGSCRLLNNLHVRGTLKNDPTFVLDGQNLWDIHTHDGGVLNLVGTEKSAWTGWDGHRFLDEPVVPVVGWVVGDRLVVTPTKVGVYSPSEMTWTGDWATMVRPVNSPDKVLAGGRIALPEVANLSQTAIIKNVTRIMMHEAEGQPNVHTLKWLKVLNSGKNQLAFYPIHFHHLADSCRGSLVEGVVVEGGKNHAFVPHDSHGVSFKDCVAYNTSADAFWWDPPPSVSDPVNDSDDIIWEHCLVAGLTSPTNDTRLTAFSIGAGNGNRCIDSVATCVRGSGQNISGFLWRENFVWIFEDCTAHNIQKNGIYTWTNTPHRHIIDGFTAYNFARAGIEHGAYRNQFVYRNCSLTVTNPIVGGSGNTQAIRQHARSSFAGLLFENIVTDDRLTIDGHGDLALSGQTWTVHRNCHYTSVIYSETGGSGSTPPSQIRYEDCGLVPAKFSLGGGIVPTSEIEITEAGVLTHRWANGVWT